jgi:hypothetical protein
MQISKAIELLKDDLGVMGERKSKELRAAQRLSIKALQFFKGAQEEAGGYQCLHLIGETEEQECSKESASKRS